MKIKFNDTFLQFDVQRTNDNIGLKEGDNWCNIKFLVDNADYHYESEGLFLTYEELVRSSKEIMKFYEAKVSFKQKITFIKNYFWVVLEEKSDCKCMTIHLNKDVLINGEIVHTHKIILIGEEIEKFVNNVLGQIS